MGVASPPDHWAFMSFEVNTLFLLTIDVEAILGLLLLLVWVQNTRVHAVAWWAIAHLMRATSVMLYGLYGSVPDLISIDLPNVLLFSSFGVTWNGARVFNGRNALARLADRGRRAVAARLAMARPRCGRIPRPALGDDHRGLYLAHRV